MSCQDRLGLEEEKNFFDLLRFLEASGTKESLSGVLLERELSGFQ